MKAKPEPVTVSRSQPCNLMLAEMERFHQRIAKPEDLEDALLAVACENAAKAMARSLDDYLYERITDYKT